MYIQEKVNPILEALVTAVLLERPEDPSHFMLKWLCEQTKSIDGPGPEQGQAKLAVDDIVTVRAEILRLKERKSELLALRGKTDSASVKTDVKTDADDKTDADTKSEGEFSSSEEEDDDAPDMPLPPPPHSRGPRQSVSAEAYGCWNVKAEFKAPVFEKTDEQKARIEKCIAPSFMFNSLQKEDMNTVLMAFKERRTDAGESIITAGDDGECMFLIEEGKVDCFKNIDGVDKLVKTCISGDVFGELALLYNCPRAATVKTTEASILWELDRNTFNNIVKDAAAKKRDTYTDFLKKVPLLENVEPYELMTIADALKMDIVEGQGVEIIKQGDQGDKFFIVMEGVCVAKKAFVEGQEPQTVMTHKVGDYFGELALINNDKRAATVCTSAATTKVLYVDRKTFKRLMGPMEDILRREAKRYEAAPGGKDFVI